MPGGNGRLVPGGGVPASRRFLVLALPTAHVSQRAVPAARRLGRNAGRATGARSRCAGTWVAGGRFAGVLRGRSGGPGEGTWDREDCPDAIYFGVLAKLGAASANGARPGAGGGQKSPLGAGLCGVRGCRPESATGVSVWEIAACILDDYCQ